MGFSSTSILLQITFVGLLAMIIFIIAYSLPQKIAATGLLLLIPFQPVETWYATANVILAYIVFIAMLMRGKDVRLPMLPQILFFLFACLISMGLAHPSTYIQHALYIFQLISAVLVFWISYDLALRFESPREMMRVFIVMNVLVAIYCMVQLIQGPDSKFMLFGLQELSMMYVRADYRLTGPFGGPGIIAEFLVIMIYVIIHQILTTTSAKYRRGLIVLVGVNLLLLIATGNRGGFLTLIGAGIIFLWMFRHLLGVGRALRIALGGSLLLLIAAAITVNYTDFDTLFDRLGETEFEEGLPDTRSSVWPVAWREIQKKPFFGHGPRLVLQGSENPRAYKGHTNIAYPHNLYLFLLFTVGIVGLVAFIVFFVTPLFRCWRISKMKLDDPYVIGFAKTGVVIMIVFFIDQIKIEFLRYGLIDYWHFVFAILGVLVAFCDRANYLLGNNASHAPRTN